MNTQKIRITTLVIFIVSLFSTIGSLIWAMMAAPDEIIPLIAIGFFTLTFFTSFYIFLLHKEIKEWFRIAKERSQKKWSIDRIPKPILVYMSSATGVLLAALGFPIAFRTYVHHEFNPIGPFLVFFGIILLFYTIIYNNKHKIYENWPEKS